MIQKIGHTIIALLFIHTLGFAQGFAWGAKGGMTIGLQQWDNSFGRNALFRYHGDLYIESLTPENSSALFASIGYHIKGSSIQRLPIFNPINNSYAQLSTNYQFRNASLVLGVKKKYNLGANKAYYMFGLRGDYTINTNLDNPEFINNTWAPKNEFVRNFIGGLTIGGGVEMMFGELMGGMLELSINPDLTRQYDQPFAIENVVSPWQPGQTITIPRQRITNTTFEISLGLRFLNKVTYID